MVCSLGSGRMAAMARLLAAGSFSETIAEEVGHWKLAEQYIHRELREADEANLLDEEDMHVFDLRPMTDTLHLVCCNVCKKPVKASQYAAHAELCKSLNSAEEISSELGDGGTGHKKPPRKERKKLSISNSTASIGEQERFESIDTDDVAGSESNLDEQIQMTSSFSMENKRNSSSLDAALTKDGSGFSHGNKVYPSGSMPPPTKRSKPIAAEGQPISDHLETASGVTKSLYINTQEAFTFREFPRESSAGSKKTCDHVVRCQKPVQAHKCCVVAKDVPVPLATKMFYSQKNQCLRSALSHLYYKGSSKDHCGDLVNPKVSHGNIMRSQTSSTKNVSHEQIDDNQEKRGQYLMPSADNTEHILPAHSSELYLSKSGGCSLAMSFSSHDPVDNVLKPHVATVGMMRSNYLSKPYSFSGNSGTPLRTMQQPKGSVPVI